MPCSHHLQLLKRPTSPALHLYPTLQHRLIQVRLRSNQHLLLFRHTKRFPIPKQPPTLRLSLTFGRLVLIRWLVHIDRLPSRFILFARLKVHSSRSDWSSVVCCLFQNGFRSRFVVLDRRRSKFIRKNAIVDDEGKDGQEQRDLGWRAVYEGLLGSVTTTNAHRLTALTRCQQLRLSVFDEILPLNHRELCQKRGVLCHNTQQSAGNAFLHLEPPPPATHSHSGLLQPRFDHPQPPQTLHPFHILIPILTNRLVKFQLAVGKRVAVVGHLEPGEGTTREGWRRVGRRWVGSGGDGTESVLGGGRNRSTTDEFQRKKAVLFDVFKDRNESLGVFRRAAY